MRCGERSLGRMAITTPKMKVGEGEEEEEKHHYFDHRYILGVLVIPSEGLSKPYASDLQGSSSTLV